MAIEFDGTEEPTGLEVYDSIEQRRLHVRTSDAVSPEPFDDDGFCFPINRACVIETDSLTFDQLYFVDVHDEDGQTRQNLEAGESAVLDDDVQFVGLTGPIKLYCRVTEPGRIETGLDSIRITFDRPTRIAIGARSLHERPAGTIRTPDDPTSMMRALSALPSALKTTSSERSWPTLRGHPPLIERGDALEIPSELESPGSDVTVEVPPTYGNLYAVAPLAFYLGADVQPGHASRIRTPVDTYRLGDGRRLEDDVARTLKRVFLLDCVVRTEGLYGYDLHERDELEPTLPFDLSETYDAPLPERLDRYLEVPFDAIEAHVPRWPLTAHVPSRPDAIELIPFVLNELGIVRQPRGESLTVQRSRPQAARSGLVRSVGERRSPTFAGEPGDETRVVEPTVDDESIEHAWFGDEVPRGASKATIEAYRNQLSRGSRNESIEILLVCNDARMIEEHNVLDGAYGSRETLPFDIESEFGVSSDRLASLLTDGGYDYLHYIGHATPDGLRCPDDELDVRSLSSVDLGVFFLNACQSYEQGLALTRQGAFGGVATLGDVVNEFAVDVGEKIARLLNFGFPLRAALELTKDATSLGEQYLIVGDGSIDIAQSDGGAPGIDVVDRLSDGDFSYSAQFYPTKEFKIGTTTSPTFEKSDRCHITPGSSKEEITPLEELRSYLIWTEGPVLLDGQLRWNNSVGFDGLS